nr:MAG TPA: hypothetical protein [Caudoviricetes sp.]
MLGFVLEKSNKSKKQMLKLETVQLNVHRVSTSFLSLPFNSILL